MLVTEVFENLEKQRCIACLLPSSLRAFLVRVETNGQLIHVPTVQFLAMSLQVGLRVPIQISKPLLDVVS